MVKGNNYCKVLTIESSLPEVLTRSFDLDGATLRHPRKLQKMLWRMEFAKLPD
jgi:hypothetical protein